MWAEFTPPGLEDWLAQVAKEASGKTPQQLSSRSWEGLIYPACGEPTQATSATQAPAQPNYRVLDLRPDDRLSQLPPARVLRGPLGLGALTALANALPDVVAVEMDLGQLLTHQDPNVVAEALYEQNRPLEIRLSSHSWAQQGADAVHELAWSMAGLIEVLRALDKAQPGQLSLKLCAGPRLLLEVAKWRAARHLWDTVCQGFGLDWPARIHLIQDARYHTRQDPHNNLLRSTVAALAGLLGGAASIELLPCDNSTEASRWADNILHLLQWESGLQQAADPLAGSGLIEQLTRSLAEHAWTEVKRIEAAGGLQAQTDLSARAHEQRLIFADQLRRDQQGLVGVNRYVQPTPAPTPAPPLIYSTATPVSCEHAGGQLRADKPLLQTGLLPPIEPLFWSRPFEELHSSGLGKTCDVLVLGEETPLLKARQDYLTQWLAMAGMQAHFHHHQDASAWTAPEVWILCSEEPHLELQAPVMAGKPPEGYAGIAVYRGCDRVFCLQQLLDRMAGGQKGARLAPPWAIEP
jgi:hypothetical protein